MMAAGTDGDREETTRPRNADLSLNSRAEAFGPVPSRRLGRSIGVNNIPPKTCSFSCVYCQLGRTHRMLAERRRFYSPEDVAAAVRCRLDAAATAGESVDVLTFVADGEPTLDLRLGETIDRLRPFDLPIAVISNASLIGDEGVRRELAKADWVSLKIDAVDPQVWRRIDRPHRSLDIRSIHNGILRFAESFRGTLVTETMLVAGLNDRPQAIEHVASYLQRVSPHIAYLSAPIRPPAEARVRVPDAGALMSAYRVVGEAVDRVELLIGYEGDAFAASGNAEEDLLAITAVHPMRHDAVTDLLSRCEANWSIVDRLIDRGALVVIPHRGHRYYMRSMPGRR